MKNNKGITLIALVITIVIIIILAAVSLNIVLGDNGIIKSAQKAQKKETISEIEAEIKMALDAYTIDKAIDSNANIRDVLIKELDQTEITKLVNNDSTLIIDYKGESFKFDLNTGNVKETTTVEIWDPTAMSVGLIGEGTKETPYLINNSGDLNYMMTRLKDQGYNPQLKNELIAGLEEDGVTPNGKDLVSCGACYKLTTDIEFNDITDYDKWVDGTYDMSKLNKWNPAGIGTDKYFEFNGDGHELIGLYCVQDVGSSSCTGFFSYISTSEDMVFKNIIFTNVFCEYYAYGYCGALSGQLYTYNSTTNAVVENCSVSGIIRNKEGDYGYAGGLIGNFYGARCVMKNCYNFASVEGITFVGGHIGMLSNGTVENCINYGSIKGRQCVGGIVGESQHSNDIIKNCINYGNVQFKESNDVNFYSYLGGIVGRMNYGKLIENCYNYGKLHEHSVKDSKKFTQVGGIAGILGTSATVRNLYNYADINILSDDEISYASIGGIVGYVSSIYDKDVVIENANNYGNITSNKDDVAGIVGGVYFSSSTVNKLKLINCKNEGTIFNNKQFVGTAHSNIEIVNN